MNNNHPDNDLLNALNHTLPEAEKAFQDNLEEQLMAQLQETSTRQNVEDITMRLFSEKQKRTQGSARSFLTLIAAVIAIGITGGLLLFVQGSSNLTLQEAVCDYSGEYHSYQVQSGDTLPSLSEQFGISIDNLANANCFDDNTSGLSTGQVITIPVSDPSDNTVTEEQIVNDTIPDLEDNQNHPRVAIVIGHSGQEPNPGAICTDGVNELAINQAIAEASARELVMSGYQVDILTQFDNDFQDYYASLLIELHVLGCSDDSTSGYQAGYNNAPGANTLQACLSDNYENSTGLAPLREDFELSQNNQRSYIVDNIHPATPGLVLSMGTLNSDRQLLLDEQERIISGIVSTVDCFMRGASDMNLNDNYTPMVIAGQDIPLNTLITEDMLVTVLVPNDFMNELQPMESSFMNVLSGPELAIGQYAATLIRQYEPVLSEDIREPIDCDDDNYDCLYLPPGTIAFSLITDEQTLLFMSNGQHIDILMPLQFITRFNGAVQIVSETHLPLEVVPELRLETIVSDAILLDTHVDGDNILVTMALIAPDAVMMERLSESDYSNMHFVPHVTPVERNNNEGDYLLTEDEFVIVSIPLSQHNNGRVSTSDVGNQYDVHFSLPYGYNDDPNEMTTEAGDVSIVSIAGNRIVINNSTLLYFGSGNEDYPPPSDMDGSMFVSFSVNPADVWLVNRYIQQGAFFSLQ